MDATAKITAIAAVMLIAVVLSFWLSFPAMLLWNLCLVPAIPAIAEVGWLQMWGIIILAGLMFRTRVSADTK